MLYILPHLCLNFWSILQRLMFRMLRHDKEEFYCSTYARNTWQYAPKTNHRLLNNGREMSKTLRKTLRCLLPSSYNHQGGSRWRMIFNHKHRLHATWRYRYVGCMRRRAELNYRVYTETSSTEKKNAHKHTTRRRKHNVLISVYAFKGIPDTSFGARW